MITEYYGIFYQKQNKHGVPGLISKLGGAGTENQAWDICYQEMLKFLEREALTGSSFVYAVTPFGKNIGYCYKYEDGSAMMIFFMQER